MWSHIRPFCVLTTQFYNVIFLSAFTISLTPFSPFEIISNNLYCLSHFQLMYFNQQLLFIFGYIYYFLKTVEFNRILILLDIFFVFFICINIYFNSVIQIVAILVYEYYRIVLVFIQDFFLLVIPRPWTSFDFKKDKKFTSLFVIITHRVLKVLQIFPYSLKYHILTSYLAKNKIRRWSIHPIDRNRQRNGERILSFILKIKRTSWEISIILPNENCNSRQHRKITACKN